jgi:hypothetical protein
MMTITRSSCRWLLAACSLVILTGAADRFDQKDFQAGASFELTVSKSDFLRAGTSRIDSRQALVALVHGLGPGNTDGLEVVFLTRPVTQASLPDVLGNDAAELRRGDHAVMHLYLDKQRQIIQVNATLIVPGTTVTRTIAWKAEDLQKYFVASSFRDGRLILKSTGSYAETDPAQEMLKLTWSIDLDLPVMREVTR